MLNLKLVFEHAFRNGERINNSSDLVLSENDIIASKKLIDCSKILDVKLLNHIIIGRMGYFRLKEKKLCEF